MKYLFLLILVPAISLAECSTLSNGQSVCYSIGFVGDKNDGVGHVGSSSHPTHYSGVINSPTIDSQFFGGLSFGIGVHKTEDAYKDAVEDNIKRNIGAAEKAHERLRTYESLRSQNLMPVETSHTFELKTQGYFRSKLDEIGHKLTEVHPIKENQVLAKEYGIQSLYLADQSFMEREFDDADFFKGLAGDFAELALGFFPASSLAQNTYELLSGKSFISHRELSPFSRGIAFAGIVSLGAPKIVAKMSVIYNKLAARFHNVEQITEAVQRGKHFIATSMGKAFSKIRSEGVIADDVAFQFYERSASQALNHPLSDRYARLLPGNVADEIARGIKPLSQKTEAFITAEEDVLHLTNDLPHLSKRLGLYDDAAGQIPRVIPETDVLVTFKLDRAQLARFEKEVEGSYNMYIVDAGKTVGEAREWITHPDLFNKVTVTEVKIVKLNQ